MSGTTVTLRPAALVSGGSGWTYGGGATTVYGATSDDSDATYAMGPDGSHPARVSFTTLTPVPVGAQIRSVGVRIRAAGNSSAPFSALMYRYGTTGVVTLTAGSKPGAMSTYSFQPRTTDPSGAAWTVALVNYVAIQIAAASTAVHFAEMYMDVIYNEIPVVAVTAPSGSQSSQTPAITWTYTDPEGDAQERYWVQIFDSATSSAAGFNPDMAAPAATSGEVYSSDLQWTGSPALPAGAYVVYVKVSDAGSSGRYSAWALSSFTIVGDPPQAPTIISATADSANGRNVIVVQQGDNFLTAQQAGADGAAGEPLRWVSVTNTNAPSDNAGTGVTGDSIRFTTSGSGAALVRTAGTGASGFPVPASAVVYWSGAIKAGVSTGTAHLDLRCYDAAGADLGTSGRTGSVVTISGSYQTSSGSATLPAGAVYGALEWTIAAAGVSEVFDTDNNSVRLGTPAGPARGGLDSRNLLGKNDSSFVVGGSAGNWQKTASATGAVALVADANAYDGAHLEYQPGSVGASHVLTLGSNLPLPIDGGSALTAALYQFQFYCRANVGSLHAEPYLYWYGDQGVQIGGATSFGGVTLPNGATFSPAYLAALAPDDATHFNVQIVLSGEALVTDRFIFDRFMMIRMPGDYRVGAVQPFRPAPAVDTFASVEYSDDSGATWQVARYTNFSRYDPFTRRATVYDYEAPPNTARIYRAQTGGTDFNLDPVNGADIISPASANTSGVALVVTDFYLTDPYTQQRIKLPIVGDIAFSSNEPQATFDPLGRPYTVILSDVVKGNTFSFRLAFNTATEYDTFAALRDSQHVLYLQSPARRAWYIKFTGARAATWMTGTMRLADGGLFTVDITASEVGRPAIQEE